MNNTSQKIYRPRCHAKSPLHVSVYIDHGWFAHTHTHVVCVCSVGERWAFAHVISSYSILH